MSIMLLKWFKLWKVPAVVGSIVIVSALINYTLLHFKWDLKAAEVNVKHIPVQELILYELKLDHNTVEAIKNICCTRDEGVVDHRKVT